MLTVNVSFEIFEDSAVSDFPSLTKVTNGTTMTESQLSQIMPLVLAHLFLARAGTENVSNYSIRMEELTSSEYKVEYILPHSFCTKK